MNNTAEWTPNALPEADLMITSDDSDSFQSMASGWWILPGTALGALGWVGIFYVIFQ